MHRRNLTSKTIKSKLILGWVSFFIASFPFKATFAALDLTKIKLKPGFKIEIFADKINNARSMALGSQGTVFVGTRSEGKVYAILDKEKKKKVITIAQDLNMPNGVAFFNGALYVAEISRILRFDQIEEKLKKGQKTTHKTIYDQFPKEEHHGWKYMAFGPDGSLYVSIGVPCNICKPQDPKFGTIVKMSPDGKNLEVFAEGIRNSVGFDWHPQTKDLWFTDNGRDWMGDNSPPDELNCAPKKGLHFGFPYCHGGNIPDPKFGSEKPCSEFKAPALNLGAHVAALGMKFWNNQIIIAEHGSWNRSSPIGYRLMSVDINQDQAKNYSPFAEGWLQNGKVLGRPVDILVLNSNTILVSDDFANLIYKIRKTE